MPVAEPLQTFPPLTESLENYIEAIYQIALEKRVARSKDIAARLSVKCSSVTAALRTLADRGLVSYVPYGLVTLTPEGLELAANVAKRHEVLRDFLVNVLAVAEEEAEEAACKMEHALSLDVLDKLVNFVAKVKAHDAR